MGDRLYAIPWSALTLDTNEECFRLDVTPDRIKNAPGFFKDRWPSMADPQWGTTVPTGCQFFEAVEFVCEARQDGISDR